MQNNHKEKVYKRLEDVLRKKSLKNSLNGFLVFLICLVILLTLTTTIELFGNYSSDVRTTIFWVNLLLIIFLFIYFIIYRLLKDHPYIKKTDFITLAKDVGNNFPEIKDELSNSLQLLENNNSKNYVLIDKAFERIYKLIESIDLSSFVKYSSLNNKIKLTSILIVSFLLLFISTGFSSSFNRIINYDKEFVEPPKFEFIIEPGNAKVTKGNNLVIKIRTNGDSPNTATFHKKTIEDSDYTTITINSDSNDVFVLNESNIKNSFKYYVSSNEIISNKFDITVVNRPLIKNLNLEIIPPIYSRLPKSYQKDNGNITALVGSRIKLDLISTKKLSNSVIIWDDKKSENLLINNDSANIDFSINNNSNYFIELTDFENIKSENSITYEIKTISDQYPIVDVLSPTSDVKLNDENSLSLSTKISDDYGFQKFIINYKLSASQFEPAWENYKTIELPITKNKEQEVFYNWDLSSLNLAVEDVVSYYYEVFDNDNISGPKSAKSKIYNIRIPSLDELFEEADEAQEIAQDDLLKTLDDANELKEEFEKLSDELKKDEKEITFDEKEKIEKALEKFEKISDKIKDVQKKLSEMQKSLQENNLLSKETLEKYMELQELMDELTSEDMKLAMQNMQKMLDQLKRNGVQNQLDQIQKNEEFFKKSIERTINLLKRIQVEQKIDELLKRSESLQAQQDDINNNNNSDKNEQADKQENVAEDLQKFEEELEKLKKKMEALDKMPKEQMDKLLEEFKKQQNQKLAKELAKKMMQPNSQTQQQQQQLSQNLDNLNSMMQNLQQQMMQQNQMQTMQDMMKIIDDILSVSKEQEMLKDQIEELQQNSPSLNENAQKQSDLRNDLSKVLSQMGNLSQRSFAISPEMGKSLSDALANMGQAINSMQSGNSSAAGRNQSSAMGKLNESAKMMNNMLNNMMSGGSGGGMMSLMQQMQQLSQQQMSLNQLTKMLNQGTMSQEQMQQLQRLSQEQELVRKSLEQLNKEAKESGQTKKLPSNLEKILEDMKEVVSSMQTQKMDDELIQKQERILSKLLDAQRSINERDFEKQRESFAGKNFNRESPPELILNNSETQNQIRDELIKAIRQGYLKDYEELIRKYYKALQKENYN